MQDYIIIYGDETKTTLDIAQDFSWEFKHYRMASEKVFQDEKEAIKYAIELAKRHGLKYEGRKIDSLGEITEHDFLDSEDDYTTQEKLNTCKTEIQEILNKFNCELIAADEWSATLILEKDSKETIKI